LGKGSSGGEKSSFREACPEICWQSPKIGESGSGNQGNPYCQKLKMLIVFFISIYAPSFGVHPAIAAVGKVGKEIAWRPSSR
jgi:hypothetical protein